MDCSSSCIWNLAHSGRNLSFFILFSFFPHISSQKFSPSTFYSSSAKAAVWMLCEMLYWFLLLMPFSFGDRIALSVRCFLLSFIAEMDHPWLSLLSPCHMWKVPLPVMDITCLVEYCQNKFIWLSVIQNPLMYLHSLSLCAHTHTHPMESFSCHCTSLALLGHCTDSSQSTGTCKPQQTTCLRGKQHWKHIFVAKPDLRK